MDWLEISHQVSAQEHRKLELIRHITQLPEVGAAMEEDNSPIPRVYIKGEEEHHHSHTTAQV